MSHTQECWQQALGAAHQHAKTALGAGMFASVPKRTSVLLDDLERLADKLLAEERTQCRCSDTVQVEAWQRYQSAVRSQSAERRRLTVVSR